MAQAFASVATTQLHSEVVAPSPAPTAVPTLAPTVSPTTVEYYEKQQRKARLRIAALIGIVVAAVVVAGCAAVAIVVDDRPRLRTGRARVVRPRVDARAATTPIARAHSME